MANKKQSTVQPTITPQDVNDIFHEFNTFIKSYSATSEFLLCLLRGICLIKSIMDAPKLPDVVP